jgi:hypothetical protein
VRTKLAAVETNPNLSWLLVVVPAITGLFVAMVQRQASSPRPVRRLGHLVDALSKTPEGSKSRAAIDALAARLALDMLPPDPAAKRKLNPFALTWVIIFVLITAGVMLGLAQWILATAGSGWNAVAWIVTGVVGLGLGLLVAAALSTIYNPVESKSKK